MYLVLECVIKNVLMGLMLIIIDIMEFKYMLKKWFEMIMIYILNYFFLFVLGLSYWVFKMCNCFWLIEVLSFRK